MVVRYEIGSRILSTPVLAVCAGLAVLNAQAAITNVVVQSGETFTVTGTAADGINTRGSTIDAQGGATLRFEPTGGNANCWYSIQATNGLVTLDVSADAAADLKRRFRAVYASGTGGFRVKGDTTVYQGRGDDSGAYIPFSAANFSFVDGDGAAVDGKIVFDAYSFITALPVDPALKCTCEFKSNDLALGGDNPLGLQDGQCWTSTVAKIRLASTNVVPAACRVRSAKGGMFILSPGTPAPFGSTVAPLWDASAVPETDVELDEGTLFMGQLLRRYEGVVTGRGSVAEGNSLVSLVRMGAGSEIAVSSAMNVRTVQAGATALSVPLGCARFRSDSGTTVALREGFDWEAKVASWFDPSQTGTCQNVGHFTGHAGEYDFFYTNDYMLVEGIVDCRGADGVRRRLINNRLTSGGSVQQYPDFYPYLVTNGPNGRSYLSFGPYRGSGTRTYTKVSGGTASSTSDSTGERRRLFVTSGTATGVSSYAAKTVVMVFGSQQGGGAALLGTQDKALKRGNGASTSMEHSLNDPIALTNNRTIWLDGEEIADNTAARFSGGWQVVSIDVHDLNWYGLGLPGDQNSHPDSGGQNYGEILVFTNALTSVERASVEWYLARKWGLADQYKGTKPSVTNRLEATGNGTVDVSAYDEIELGGNFTGTVKLGGGMLIVPDELLPFTEATLPTANRAGWFDPSCRDHVSLAGDEYVTSKPNYVIGLWNRDEEKKATDVRYFTQQMNGPRRPCYVTTARGIGPTRAWIDNNHTLYPEDRNEGSAGNALRMRRWNGTFGQASDDGVPFQTAFIVQDSTRGGGTPILDSFTAAGDIKGRTTDDPSVAIWSKNTAADIANGTVRLNGDVRTAANGFTGGPELFSFATVNGKTVNAVSLGYYVNSDNRRDLGEIFGEVLLYDGLVADAERKRIEGYLMGKWLGRMPAGVSDPTGATVEGTGLVTSRLAARLPKFDAAFAGTVQVADATLPMAYDGAGFTGTVLAPAATLDLPANCTIVLDLPSKPDVGRYDLVSAGAWTRNVSWTLEVTGAFAQSRALQLIVDPLTGKVTLDVGKKGLSLIFR